MNKMSQIRSLKELDAQRAIARKRVNKREQRLMRDLQGIQNDWQHITDSIARVRFAVGTLAPKLEYATLLMRVVKRIFRRK